MPVQGRLDLCTSVLTGELELNPREILEHCHLATSPFHFATAKGNQVTGEFELNLREILAQFHFATSRSKWPKLKGFVGLE